MYSSITVPIFIMAEYQLNIMSLYLPKNEASTRSTDLHNILLESAPSLAVLVPALSSMAAVSKAFTPLPRKSDRSDAEVDECRQELSTHLYGLNVESTCSYRSH